MRVGRQTPCMGCTILYNEKMIEALIEAIGLFFSEFFDKRKKKKKRGIKKPPKTFLKIVNQLRWKMMFRYMKNPLN